MHEMRAILDAARRLRQEGEPFLVATVVRVRGSAYRRPGARMLLTRDRWIAGSVSGGCLEGDVVKKGWWRTRDGSPKLVTYDTTASDESGAGLGLGCDGVIDVLLERAGEGARVDPLAFIADCVAAQERGALATALGPVTGRGSIGARVCVHSGRVVCADVEDTPLYHRLAAECLQVLASGETRTVTCPVDGVGVDVLVEAILPPPRLFVLGTGYDAVPVVTFARALGWETIVCEPSTRPVTRERFANADALLVGGAEEVAAQVNESACAAAVIMAHDYERDRASLKALVGSRAGYVGVLGPRRRTERMLDELGLADMDPRVHSPVGLALGAETPQEIALAIVAEIQSVLARASGASLRDRVGRIHESADRTAAAE